jgi:general L-amino acid transport system substrate-binding protein
MANVRSALHAQTSRFKVLPETITVEPMSPVYRTGDPQWASLVDWTVWVLLPAEEHGVTQANVGRLAEGRDPRVQRLTGAMPWMGKALGVSDAAFRHAIEAVGNYGEIYERDVGSRSALDLPRGRNDLAARGGLMWALPAEP